MAVAVHLWKPSDASLQEKLVQRAGTATHFAADPQATQGNQYTSVPPQAYTLQHLLYALHSTVKSNTLLLSITTLICIHFNM